MGYLILIQSVIICILLISNNDKRKTILDRNKEIEYLRCVVSHLKGKVN